MFFPGSRYAEQANYRTPGRDGLTVQAVRLPLPSPAAVQGYHRRLAGQRLDHIANRYLADATAFWRLCDANNSVVPDTLAAADLVGVPSNAPGTG